MKLKLLIVFMGLCASVSHAQERVQNVSFNGDYFEGGSKEKLGIIVLGGSGGRKSNERAQKIADMGFNVLSLSYFDRDGAEHVPETLELIPLEYFEEPKRWLEDRSRGVVIYGVSKGAELSLVLGSNDPDYKAIIALAPSHVVWQGNPKDFSKIMESPSSWSKDGEGLPFVPYISRDEQKRLGYDNRHEASLTNDVAVEKALIGVENISSPVLLLSGGQDKSWPAFEMGNKICERMESFKAGSCTHITYAQGDHTLTNFDTTSFAEVREFLEGLD